MSLSDREKQILADIEARLREEDPRFARAVATAPPEKPQAGRLRWAIVGFAVGVLLLFGIVAHLAWGIAGFAVMLGSALIGANELKRVVAERNRTAAGERAQQRPRLGRFLEQRRHDADDE